MNQVKRSYMKSEKFKAARAAYFSQLVGGNLSQKRLEKEVGKLIQLYVQQLSAPTSIAENPLQATIKEIEDSMVLIDTGTFQMGSLDEEGYGDEHPMHGVSISSFHLSKYQVTQAQWEAVMGSNPSQFKEGDAGNRPVERVSFDDCMEFISKFNEHTGKKYRLPTEAEWEYAAKGGNQPDGTKYAGSDDLNTVAWNWDNSNSTTHPVGLLAPNSLGLYDMSGNVWEWCSDWKGGYEPGHQINPQGPLDGQSRVLRGGSWYLISVNCRVACRGFFDPSDRFNDVGLRLARD